MDDLYTGMAIMGTGTLVLAAGAMWFARRAEKRVIDLWGLGVILLIVLFVFVLRDGLWMARLLPYSNLVIVGNWLPLLAGALAGLLVPRLRGRRAAQILWAAALLLTAAFAIVDPLRGKPPLCHNKWDEVCLGCVSGGPHELVPVCRQTSQVTCSPAAACTLLAQYEIESHESEMADDCLTRNGTTWQGLFRGLKLATAGTTWDVVPIMENDFETLLALPGPKLLFVELKAGTDYDPRYAEKWGWIPGRRHTVVLYERIDSERYLVGDPAIGLEEWSTTDIETLWHGRGMRLVNRDGTENGQPGPLVANIR